MDFELKTLTAAEAARTRADALVVLAAEGALRGQDPVARCVARARVAGDFEPKPGRLLPCYAQADIAAPRLLVAGAGDATAGPVARAVSEAVGALKDSPVRHLVLLLPETAGPGALQAALRAAADASYVYTTTKPSAEPRRLARITVGVADAARFQDEFAQAAAAVRGIELAKEWGNRPANHATPTLLAEAARALAVPGSRIGCEVLGPREVERLGMGALMAVAQGSAEELRFIVLRYQGGTQDDAPVVLVGKGITFDTGGISIKPAAEMDEMKFDMCGAASVLGTFAALAALQPAVNAVGLIAACENMPDGRALKPGDVVTSMSGQTIEVLNTDAEGRLVLCDALCYARRFEPRAVVDIATLTGACVIALGAVRSGLFSGDDALAADLLAAGEAAHDPCWRMPLDDEYAQGLKTPFADVANVAGRPAGAVTAAKFLQRFTDGMPWAHLDIAGTAWKGGKAKGATGRPVALLLHYVLAQVRRGDGAIKTVAKGAPGGARRTRPPRLAAAP